MSAPRDRRARTALGWLAVGAAGLVALVGCSPASSSTTVTATSTVTHATTVTHTPTPSPRSASPSTGAGTTAGTSAGTSGPVSLPGSLTGYTKVDQQRDVDLDRAGYVSTAGPGAIEVVAASSSQIPDALLRRLLGQGTIVDVSGSRCTAANGTWACAKTKGGHTVAVTSRTVAQAQLPALVDEVLDHIG